MVKLKPTIIDEIVILYNEGIPIADISKRFKTDHSRIYYHLKKRGVKCNRLKKHINNEDFLYSKTVESAYFYGFILGDGCLIDNQNNGKYAISIGLHEKDISILENFCNWLQISNEAIVKNKNRVTLTIQNKTLIRSEFIQEWGLCPRKTYNPIIPMISDFNLLKAFLIGLIDADGSIRFGKKYSFNLVNNPVIIRWFIDCLRLLGFNGKIYKRKGNYAEHVNIYRIENIIELANLLEINRLQFILQRKWGGIIEHLNNPIKLKKDNSNSSKLTKLQVDEIKAMLKNGISQAAIAKQYCVTAASISNISRGITWA